MYDADYGEEIPRLEPFARGLYYVRNRWLDPEHGRWTTRDPNATGQVVMLSLDFHGEWGRPELTGFHANKVFGDGQSLHFYSRGDPAGVDDPLGLFGLLSGLEAGWGMADMASDMMETGFQGVLTGLGLIMTLDEYNAYQLTAVEWASDWSENDQAYARSAEWSMGTGYWAEEDEELTPEEAMGLAVVGTHDHHGFPQEFRDEFKKIGIDVDDPKFRAKLKDTYHLRVVHGSNKNRRGGAYNKFWEDFFDKEHGPRTKANAIAKLQTIKQNGWRIPRKWR